MRISQKYILLVIAVALATVVTLETLRRQALYWYDVRQDYAYEFESAATVTMQVPVTPEGLVLPAWEGAWDTALLRLDVSAGLMGWWFDPCIEIAVGTDVDRQCFERGARGARYVLLPPTAVRPGQPVRLRGSHLGWRAQTAELQLLKAPGLEGARVLVLAPHPDDAEIAAFGLYSGHESFIVTMTAGNYVDGLYSGVSGDESRQDTLRGEVRTWDSLAVPLWGGVPADHVVSLGYLTHSLKAFHDAAAIGEKVPAAVGIVPESYRQGALQRLLGGRAASADWPSVVADLVALLENVHPDFVVTPHPALDINLDHQYTTLAMLEALQKIQDDHVTLLLYDNHHRLSENYPFGPSDARVTLPPSFGGTRFSSVSSYELDADTQTRKLFALEAMHDLRGPPLRLTGGPFDVLLDRLKDAYGAVKRDPLGDYSYFRRAARPNELFFVYPPGERRLISGTPSSP